MIATLEGIAGPLESLVFGRGADEVPLALPTSVEQAAELVRLAATDGLRVVPMGLGSKLGWCDEPERVDFAISTRRLDAIVAHEPADGTLTAQAGATLSTLRERARAGGHWLTPDVARPDRATLGGVLAAGQSGLDRLRFGPARDHVLGVTVLLGDGTLARSGGRLVKNVTGFDLHKLYCGSHGSLCLIVEASLRLFPEPEREVFATVHAADDVHAERLVAAALALPSRTVSLVAERIDARWSVHARLFGKPEAVDPERALLEQAWPGAEVTLAAAARVRAEARRDAALGDGAHLRVTCRPTEAWRALACLDARLQRPDVRIQAGLAILVCAMTGDTGEFSIDCTRLRDDLARACAGGATVDLLDAPDNDYEPPTPAALAIMLRLRDSLDPRGVFARGRTGGWSR